MSGDGPPRSPVRRTAWPESAAAPLGTPIQPSVVYAARDPDALDDQYEGRVRGYAYAREGHPNAEVLGAKIDAMEGMSGGVVTGSGMAAVTAALLGLLRAGDHVVAGDQLYGRTLRMLQDDLPRFGISVSRADPTDAAAIAAAIRPETRLILVEVVSNPTLRIADMAGIRAASDRAGALLMVDHTFTTPRGVRAVDLGADVVVHSVTKMLAGHSDATLGYVAARAAGHATAIRTLATTFGLTPSPFDCWLAERGLQSFALRYDRAEDNAARLAAHLAGHPKIRRVIYPGRADHPDHARLGPVLGGRAGTMVSFELDGGRAAANAFTRAVPELPFAPTLGDVATLLSHPASSSHRGLTREGRAALGITEGFFRTSLGIEEPDFLLDAFSRGLAAV